MGSHKIRQDSRNVAFIDAVHFEIHEGNTYFISYKNPDASPIADNGTIIFVLEVGATKQIHIIFAGSSGGDAQLELYEDTVFTLGTPMTAYNRNRHKQNQDADVTVTPTRDPTVAGGAEGTLLQDKFLAGGTGGNSPGSNVGARNEWVLDIKKTYMLRLTNRAGNAQPMSLEAEWYEVNAEVIV